MQEPSAPGGPRGIDSTRPHVARIWNYWLGGKDNYPVDRKVGDELLHVLPEVAHLARASRAFLTRVVTHLAAEAGVDQFLDIGTGLPTHNNTHQVAQALVPEARIVYVDNDPMVLAHARALLVGTPEGATDYIDADLRDPGAILETAARTLDFTRPVAVMLMGVMEFIVDDEEAHAIVRRLREALAPGSYLAMYDGTSVIHPERSREVARQWNAAGNIPLVLRTPEGIAGFFRGLEVLEPGVVPVSRWRAEPTDIGDHRDVDAFGAVGRVPHDPDGRDLPSPPS